MSALNYDLTERRNAVKHLVPKVKDKPLEKDVKDAVKKLVRKMASHAYIFMPVQNGYGATDLDFVITLNGFDMRVETKIAGKHPTERQKLTTQKLTDAGVPVLWINQNNLDDLAVILDLLLVGKQQEALEVSAESREDYK